MPVSNPSSTVTSAAVVLRFTSSPPSSDVVVAHDTPAAVRTRSLFASLGGAALVVAALAMGRAGQNQTAVTSTVVELLPQQATWMVVENRQFLTRPELLTRARRIREQAETRRRMLAIKEAAQDAEADA